MKPPVIFCPVIINFYCIYYTRSLDYKFLLTHLFYIATHTNKKKGLCLKKVFPLYDLKALGSAIKLAYIGAVIFGAN